jgi:cysteine desulfurase/selenocysteine lyase
MSAQANDIQAPLDVARIRADFPLLSRSINGKPLVYLDSANTAQKPAAVIEAVDDFYRRHNANVSRAVHTLGEEATSAYEGARTKLARFINAPSRDEIVLTSGTTQAINLVAYSHVLPRSSSRRWSITRTSCRGRSSAIVPGRSSRSRRSPKTASSSSRSSSSF